MLVCSESYLKNFYQLWNLHPHFFTEILIVRNIWYSPFHRALRIFYLVKKQILTWSIYQGLQTSNHEKAELLLYEIEGLQLIYYSNEQWQNGRKQNFPLGCKTQLSDQGLNNVSPEGKNITASEDSEGAKALQIHSVRSTCFETFLLITYYLQNQWQGRPSFFFDLQLFPCSSHKSVELIKKYWAYQTNAFSHPSFHR